MQNNNETAEQLYQQLLAKHNNDLQAVARALFTENRDLRRQVRTLRGEPPGSGDDVVSRFIEEQIERNALGL